MENQIKKIEVDENGRCVCYTKKGIKVSVAENREVKPKYRVTFIYDNIKDNKTVCTRATLSKVLEILNSN